MMSDILLVSNKKVRGLLIFLNDYFREFGLDVSIQQGLCLKAEASLVWNHVNLTVTPRLYLDYFSTFPASVNASLIDIGKSLVCDGSLLKMEDNYDGPVIVKTNLNYGGKPERDANENFESNIVKENSPEIEFKNPLDYDIYEHARKVPAKIWKNPGYVVQEFHTERDNRGHYCLRFWYTFGSKGFHVRVTSDKPIVKGSNSLTQEIIDEPTPLALLEAKNRLGVDYGRFDYILKNGEVILFDVNRTPGMDFEHFLFFEDQFRELSLGIYDFFSKSSHE